MKFRFAFRASPERFPDAIITLEWGFGCFVSFVRCGFGAGTSAFLLCIPPLQDKKRPLYVKKVTNSDKTDLPPVRLWAVVYFMSPLAFRAGIDYS